MSSSSPQIRTVLGDIPAETLGFCDAHNHLIIDHPWVNHRFPEYALTSPSLAVSELKEFGKHGGKAVVDAMPGNAGRCGKKLKQISQETEIHIIASTGFHLERYYEQGRCGAEQSEKALADYFISEIEGNLREKEVQARAGVIKVASEEKWRLREQKIFRAAAQAHRETGAPLLTHTEQGKLALEQIELFIEEKVDLKRVVLSHTDRLPDIGYHREILSTGVGLEYDSAFRWKQGNPTLDLILQLGDRYANQILLGMDAARPTYWKAYGGKPGLSYYLTDFYPLLKSHGISDETWNQITVKNPASYFCFSQS